METSISTVAPHLEGLLHLSAVTFVITLAYLGLDKVGDDNRYKLENAIAEKADEIIKFMRRNRRIDTNGQINEIKALVGDRKVNKAISMLCAFGSNIEHDLY